MTDDRREMLLGILLAQPEVAECDTLARWLPVWRAASVANAHGGPFVAAIAAALRADRMAWVFFSGYQGAIQAGFMGRPLPAEPPIAAFCANESDRKLTEITTSLRALDGELRLDGRKAWVLAGFDDLELFVLARAAGGPERGPGSLAVVRVPGNAPGVELGAPRPQSVIPELPHAAATFTDVCVARGQLLDGDGYRDHARPFRLREDVFVTGCTLASLLVQGHLAAWPTSWRQRCVAAIVTLGECASMAPADTRTEVLTAGALSMAGEVIEQSEPFLANESAGVTRWRRDKPLLGGGRQARRQRAISAWRNAGWEDSV